MAKAIMLMGTASDVGKSVVAAGLCRLFQRRRLRVAPFKAQNMSLNSYATAEGGEMGRAQVLQAQACGLLPHVDMNPILLKPEGDNRSQVIVLGKVWGKFNAAEYFARRRTLFHYVEQSYRRLESAYDTIVIEGAGSAAEINLRDKDIVNWPVAEMADATVLLVADIDRGGVFAQVIGTLDLLRPEERRRVTGIIVNKFRGDIALFSDGVSFLEQRTSLPVLGVVPFLRDLELDQEDSVDLSRVQHIQFTPDKINVAVVLLPHMSNFTDFNSLAAEPDVILRYAGLASEITGADAVIIPGTKSTAADLKYLEQSRFTDTLRAHVTGGGELVGICGGYQILGREINDPLGIESGGRKAALGFLDVTTELTASKVTLQVRAVPLLGAAYAGHIVKGYEIHMGRTRRGRVVPAFKIVARSQPTSMSHAQPPEELTDGALHADQRVWGTYLHGVFDNPGFRRTWINAKRERKSLPPLPAVVSETVTGRLSTAIDRWTDHLERHLDLRQLDAVC
jgi:adenosylcobyric acid synthase